MGQTCTLCRALAILSTEHYLPQAILEFTSRERLRVHAHPDPGCQGEAQPSSGPPTGVERKPDFPARAQGSTQCQGHQGRRGGQRCCPDGQGEGRDR